MSFWKGKRVLITGHTGFKGSWLSLWLQKLGAEVIGYALQPPTEPNLFNTIKLKDKIISIHGDILDINNLEQVLKKHNIEIVFHLAAQPLVRKSYFEPVETFNTNIMGTVNLFDSIRKSTCTKVIINVTSDKCYENMEWNWGYREIDSMGGVDPYSCSKGCSELITNSYRKSFFNQRGIFLASTRAGNVIGGGDWAEDRLVPDIIKHLLNNNVPVLRNPNAIRPWQHVLEPLCGYIMLAEKMWNEGYRYSEPWNFGPNDESVITVSELASYLVYLWNNKEVTYEVDNDKRLHEAQFLKLDCSKAIQKLGWKPQLTIKETLEWTIDWYKAFHNKSDMQQISLNQIEKYEKLRSSKNETFNL